MKKYFIILLSVVLYLGCSSDDDNKKPIDSKISLDYEMLTFNLDGTAVDGNSVKVTASGDWRLTGDETWCKPSAQKGKSGDEITFTVENNLEENIRSVKYFFMCGNKTTELVITQFPKEIVEYLFGKTEYAFKAAGGIITTGIKFNMEIDYEIPDDSKEWIVPILRRSLHEEWLQFNVLPNDGLDSRSGSVTLFKGKDFERVITVNQEGKHVIIPEKKEYIFDLAANSVTVPIESNVEYLAVVNPNNTSWLTFEEVPQSRAMTTKNFKLIVSEAEGTRIGTISFYCLSDPSVNFNLLVKQQNPNPEKVDVPDAKFREKLEEFGLIILNEEDYYEVTDAGMKVETMDVHDSKIESFQGIEYFKKLQSINIRNNYASKIDLSKNPAITSVDIAGNGFSEIILGDIHLEELDFLGAPYAIIDFMSGKFITPEKVVVTGTNLKYLNISNSSYWDDLTKMVELDVSGCPALETLDCSDPLDVAKILWLKEGQTITELTKNEDTEIKYK